MRTVLQALVFVALFTASSATNTSTLHLGEDNRGREIYIKYETSGHNDGNDVLVFYDNYFGLISWIPIQLSLRETNYTIALEVIGFGYSSGHRKSDLEGIGGFPAYSFDQLAYFVYQALTILQPKGRIHFVGTELAAFVGIHYHLLYNESPYRFERMLFESPSLDPIVDPIWDYRDSTKPDITNWLTGELTNDPDQTLKNMYEGFFGPGRIVLEYVAVSYAKIAHMDALLSIELSMYDNDLAVLAKQVTIPVHVIYCSLNSPVMIVECQNVYDWIYGFSVCQMVIQPIIDYSLSVPDVTYTLAPSHSSVVHVSDPSGYLNILRDFFGGPKLS